MEDFGCAVANGAVGDLGTGETAAYDEDVGLELRRDSSWQWVVGGLEGVASTGAAVLGKGFGNGGGVSCSNCEHGRS